MFRPLSKKLLYYKGFTYIEVLLSIVIFSSVFTLVTYLMVSSIENRENANVLKQAILLAESKMDEIRRYKETKEESGKFENGKFSFSYFIEEVEIDLAKQAKDLGLILEEEEEEKEESNTGQTSSLVTEIPIYLYKVNILYRGNFVYSLLYFKRRSV